MAKSLLKIKALELRKGGLSVKKIAKELQVSCSSVSTWVRSVILTSEQLECLKKSSLKGAEIGRFKCGQIRRKKRAQFIQQEIQAGRNILSKLNEKELFLTGLALYWAEGSKKNRQVQFCNSDPNMIKFLLLWLKKCFLIKNEEIICWVGINEIHRQRDIFVKNYWSGIIGIPLSQFRNTSFKKVLNQKVYENFEQHYGTLFMRVVKSTRFYFKILGMIDGLSKNAKVAQWQ